MEVNYSLTPTRSLGSKDFYSGIASPQDYAICRQVMRSASKNYSSASKYLPKEVMPHVEALYAFLRVGDDRVDVAYEGYTSPMEAIEDWEATYNQAFQTCESQDPVMRAYLDTAIKFNIPKDIMDPYFRAMKGDLTTTRFPTFDDLLHYMDGSAIPVGRAMTYILGVRAPYTIQEALPGADSLSIAMQLSNFWRDIGEDWARGRIYLPLEDMDLFGYSEEDLASHRVNKNFVNLLEFQFARCEAYYQLARQNVSMLASGHWAIMTALYIYQAILTSIRANQYDVFSRRASTNKIKKFRLAASAYWMVRYQ
jgi:phytoene synthase